MASLACRNEEVSLDARRLPYQILKTSTGRMMGKPDLVPAGTNRQRRCPEVGLWEVWARNLALRRRWICDAVIKT